MKLLRLLKKRGKSGFTLVEVVISCVLLGILILGVFSVVTPIISGVKSREQSANALMLGEAADAYINRSIKNSVFVAIFENAKPDDMKADSTIPKSKQMEEMLAFINNADNKDAAGKDIYELKCIGIRWKYDAKSQQYKYMITSELVDKTTGAVDISSTSKSYDVFESCFYENLFPAFTFNIMETPVLGEDGNPTTDPPTMQEVPAIKTTINVYRDADMDEMAFSGDGYADFTNIKRQQATGYYKLFSKKGILAADGTSYVDGTGTVLREAPDPDDESLSDAEKHLETYIYYVTRKLKATTSPTPSSTPPSSTTTTTTP